MLLLLFIAIGIVIVVFFVWYGYVVDRAIALLWL